MLDHHSGSRRLWLAALAVLVLALALLLAPRVLGHPPAPPALLQPV